MPNIGEGKIKNGRSYVYLNPQVNGQFSSTGVWRLTNQDLSTGVDSSDLIQSAQVASGASSIAAGQPIYIDTSGNARTVADEHGFFGIGQLVLDGGVNFFHHVAGHAEDVCQKLSP